MTDRWYNGEIARAESGDERTYSTNKLADVVRMLRSLRDGDTLTVNVNERDDSL